MSKPPWYPRLRAPLSVDISVEHAERLDDSGSVILSVAGLICCSEGPFEICSLNFQANHLHGWVFTSNWEYSRSVAGQVLSVIRAGVFPGVNRKKGQYKENSKHWWGCLTVESKLGEGKRCKGVKVNKGKFCWCWEIIRIWILSMKFWSFYFMSSK